MTSVERWLLPDGIEEVLPPDARYIELLRRHILDMFDHWGYDFVIPPALEYLESLLTSTGQDLELRTFKVTDQLSGRLMGLSADTTSQVARIDAHSLAPEGVSRLSYCRTVFHAQETSLLASRTPSQIGAELYGEAGVAADVEIISLMIAMLEKAEVRDVHLDLGHVGAFRTLFNKAGLDTQQQQELFGLLKLKCLSDLDDWIRREIALPELAEAFTLLIRLHGDRQLLDKVVERLVQLVPDTALHLQHLQQVADRLSMRFPDFPCYFDLTELRGYDYHTGLVFAAYISGYGDAVARGGRYDETGAVFGRARPATGFSADLKVLSRLGQRTDVPAKTISAPCDDDPELWNKVRQLREQGKRVLVQLNDENIQADQSLQFLDGQWQLVEA